MNIKDNKKDKSSWIIGGMTMIGIGCGFFFIKNPLAFVACILIGIGAGLVLSAILTR